MTRTDSASPAPMNHASMMLLAVLCLLAASGPMTSDLYLPGFPSIAADFGVSASEVQLTLTAGLIGVAFGQLTLGPASDRYGRRWVLVGGLALGVIAGVVAAAAPTLIVLIVARVFQGFGTAAGLVISRAIVSDVTAGPTTVRWFGTITIIAGLGSLTAPMLGGILNTLWGWRTPLWVLSGYLFIVFLLVLLRVPNTHRPRTGEHAGRGGAGLWSIPFVGVSLTLAFAFGAYIAFVSASPFVYQEIIGMSSLVFGFVFSGQALLSVGATLVVARVAHRIDLRRIIWFGVALSTAGALGTFLIAVTGAPVILFPFALVLISLGTGVLLPSTMSFALAQARHVAGLASAVLGFLQFVVASAVAPLVSLGSAPLVTFGSILLGLAAIAIISYAAVSVALRRRAALPLA